MQSNYLKDKLEIIVVDDMSKDGTYEEIHRNFPDIKVVRNNKQRFLAGSRNIGINNSKGEFLFLVDDDNLLDYRCISELVELLKSNKQVAIAGPITYYLDEPKKILFAGVKRNLITSRTIFVAKGQEDNGQYHYPIDSDDIPNAFMVRRKIFDKIGLFDEEKFPIHYDEADFGMRVRRMGYRIIIVPDAKTYHDTRRELRYFSNPIRIYYAIRNRIVLHRMYLKKLGFLVFLTCFFPLFFIYYSIKSRQISICIMATLDGLTGKDRVREIKF